MVYLGRGTQYDSCLVCIKCLSLKTCWKLLEDSLESCLVGDRTFLHTNSM